VQFKAKHLRKTCIDVLMIKLEKHGLYGSLREPGGCHFTEFLQRSKYWDIRFKYIISLTQHSHITTAIKLWLCHTTHKSVSFILLHNLINSFYYVSWLCIDITVFVFYITIFQHLKYYCCKIHITSNLPLQQFLIKCTVWQY
jgi:hypothetical protein